jgi:hypothetical protein
MRVKQNHLLPAVQDSRKADIARNHNVSNLSGFSFSTHQQSIKGNL